MLTGVAWMDNAGALAGICLENLSDCDKYYFVESDVRSVSQGFPFRMNEDRRLIDAFNTGFLNVLSAGIESRLARKYRMDLGQCGSQSIINHQTMGHSPLQIQTLAGSFIAAAMGFIFCFIVALVEKVWHKYFENL